MIDCCWGWLARWCCPKERETDILGSPSEPIDKKRIIDWLTEADKESKNYGIIEILSLKSFSTSTDSVNSDDSVYSVDSIIISQIFREEGVEKPVSVPKLHRSDFGVIALDQLDGFPDASFKVQCSVDAKEQTDPDRKRSVDHEEESVSSPENTQLAPSKKRESKQ